MAEKRMFQQAGIEMIAIVFSVLFALVLNDWWQDRRTEASHLQTLALLKAELITNRTDLEEAITYYKEIAPKIGAALVDGVTAEEVEEIQDTGLELKSTGTSRTAHEIATITGLYSWLTPETSAAILAPYVGQEDIRVVYDALTAGIINSRVDEYDEFYTRYLVLVQSMTPSLEELLGLTNEAIVAVEVSE